MLPWLGLSAFVFVIGFTWHKARDGAASGRGQSRREAVIEAWTNIGIGFAINYCANLLLFPLFGAHISAIDNFWLGWLYTVISILRQYAIRRWFNRDRGMNDRSP